MIGEVQPGFPEPTPFPEPPPDHGAMHQRMHGRGYEHHDMGPMLPPPAPEPAASEPSVEWKPGKGLTVKSADGNFSLKTALRFQFLDEWNVPAAADAEARHYFILRRIRLTFSGNVFSKDIKYRLDLGLGVAEMGYEGVPVENKSGSTSPVDENGQAVTLITSRDVLSQGPIQDAYLEFTQLRDLNLRVGQAKIPYGLERLTSDGALQVVDRSITSSEFNFERDIGVELRSDDFLGVDKLRYNLGVYSGEGRNATTKSIGGGDLGLLYVARLELHPLGVFDAYEATDLARSSDAKLAFGLNYAFAQLDATSHAANQTLGRLYGAPGDDAVVDYNTHNFTVDARVQVMGFSAMTAFHYRNVPTIPAARSGIGWTLQAGYLVSAEAPLEIAGQFAMVRPTDEATSSIDEYNELGGGLNYYFYGQGLKLQGEYVHRWEHGYAEQADNRVRIQLQAAL